MSDQINFEQILLRISTGDKKSEQELCKRFWNGLVFVLQRQSGDRELSLDLAQDALIVVLTKARQGLIKKPESLASYVRQTGVNMLIAHRRKEKRQSTYADSIALDQLPALQPSLFESVDQSELVAFVRQAVEELELPRDRDILYRHYLFGEDKQSICSALDLSSAHYDRVLYRARQRLKELILSKNNQPNEIAAADIISFAILVSLSVGMLNARDTSSRPTLREIQSSCHYESRQVEKGVKILLRKVLEEAGEI